MNGKLQSLTATGIDLRGDKGRQTVKMLVDTGASFSMVRADVAEKIGTPAKLPEPVVLTIGDSSKISITDAVLLALDVGGKKLTDYFLIFADLIEEAILGVATMRKYGLKIDMERQAIYAAIKEEETTMNDFFKKLLAAVGITGAAENISEDDAIKLVKDKMAPISAPPKYLLQVLELKDDAGEAEIKGKILALKSPGNVVPAEKYQALEAELHTSKIESAVMAALSEGKITPAEKETWLKSLKDGTEKIETFASFISHRGKVVPIREKLPDKTSDTGATIDDASLAVMKQMGVSKETFAKWNTTAQ